MRTVRRQHLFIWRRYWHCVTLYFIGQRPFHQNSTISLVINQELQKPGSHTNYAREGCHTCRPKTLGFSLPTGLFERQNLGCDRMVSVYRYVFRISHSLYIVVSPGQIPPRPRNTDPVAEFGLGCRDASGASGVVAGMPRPRAGTPYVPV